MEPPRGVRAAAELADHEARRAAHDGRVDVLVGTLDAHRRGAVHVALVRECARADVRGVGVRRDVGHLGHEVGQLGQAGQVIATRDGGQPSLSARFAQIVTRLALPHRSP